MGGIISRSVEEVRSRELNLYNLRVCKTYLASPTIVPIEMIGNVEANSGPQEIGLPNSDVI